MKEILKILISAEEYGFMDESAQKRLSDVRALFTNAVAGNSEHYVLPLSDTMFAVFPFIGTRGTMALLYALRERGFEAEAWISRYIPVCIEVRTDRGKRALLNALDDIKKNKADKYGFSIPDNCEICGKFNDYIPRELLKKQYIEDYLDADDLVNLE